MDNTEISKMKLRDLQNDLMLEEDAIDLQLRREAEAKNTERKGTPVYSGFMKYFPNAIKEIAKCSQAGNDQHHKNEPLHWDKEKSKDELDSCMRHLLDYAEGVEFDDCGTRHIVKCGWRILAMIERTLTDKF
tara:strand:- start:12 stop:407 length:396 start_codon:yes stop_codon:yes gene_type:complete